MGMRQWLSDPRNNRAVTIGLFFALCTLPALAPGLFPLALQVNYWTQAVFDQIETLEAGDVVWVSHQLSATAYGVSKQACMDVFIHLFSIPGLKIFMWSYQDWARPTPMYTATYLLPTALPIAEKLRGEPIVYGEDYALFGWYPGLIPTISAFADDVRSVLKYDYYGTPIDDLPVMDEILTGADIDFYYHTGSSNSYALNVIWNRYKTPNAWTHSGRIMPRVLNQMTAGQLVGAVADMMGAAEYEILLRDKYGVAGVGLGLGSAAGQFIVVGFAICLAIAGNIVLVLLPKLRGTQEARQEA